jgi:hypothetical protein
VQVDVVRDSLRYSFHSPTSRHMLTSKREADIAFIKLSQGNGKFRHSIGLCDMINNVL